MRDYAPEASGSATPVVRDDASSLQHRLRHIASIQIRNFTPFPARDNLTASLAQRPGPALLGIQGHAADDADMTLAKRRARRQSAASLNNHRLPVPTDEAAHPHGPSAGTRTPRQRTSSRTSVTSGPRTSGSPSARRMSASGSFSSFPSSRPVRQRANSRMSILLPDIFQPEEASAEQDSVTAPTALKFYHEVHSESDLRDIIWSRLVETFITISLPNTVVSTPPGPQSAPPTSAFPSKPGSRKVGPEKANGTSTPRKGKETPLSRTKEAAADRPGHRAGQRSTDGRSIKSSSATRSGAQTASPHTLTFPQSPPPTPPLPASVSDVKAPIYISPIQTPSTNPTFTLQTDHSDFADWADLSADTLRLCVWSRRPADIPGNPWKGVGSRNTAITEHNNWNLVQSWDVDLAELIPLDSDLIGRPWKLPSNTPLFRLQPSGRIYHLPSTTINESPMASRSPSPEYNSEPEITEETRTSKHITFQLEDHQKADKSSPLSGYDRRSWGRELSSAAWQDLIKLADLQTTVKDTEESLRTLVKTTDALVEASSLSLKLREVSQREYRIQVLYGQRDANRDSIDSLRDVIQRRREAHNRRQSLLEEARNIHEGDILSEFDVGSSLAEERKRHSELIKRLPMARTNLLSTLSFIFPIELLSPPELLFTILSVPSPLPLSGSDPAPPLTLPGFPDVTEDSVSTALGFAAQVVHLAAEYLGHRLVYPITYVGSRSLIKDPISAMMGPRMFPLYSKGVETYRFEYAVFLLNKNIEMLMVEHNIHVLDMRHTLPNLKNLLLTLTDGEIAEKSLTVARGIPSTPPRPASLLDSGSVTGLMTPTGSSQDAGQMAGATPRAGTSTSTESDSPQTPTSTVAGTKSRSYFLPLTSLFRGRYPSSSSSATQSTSPTGDEAVEPSHKVESELDQTLTSSDQGGSDEDEEDRRTIRAVQDDDVRTIHDNGRAQAANRGGAEKVVDVDTALPSVEATVSHAS